MPDIITTNDQVVFVQATSQEFKTLTQKDVNTIYFITDSKDIYLGDVCYTANNVRFTDQVPAFETAEADVIYVVSSADGNVLYIKGDSAMEVAGGHSKVSIDDIASILEKGTTGDNTKIPSVGFLDEKIAEAVKGMSNAIVNVEATRKTDNSGTALKFIPKQGDPIEVTIADLFLSSAEYNNVTHELSLTVKGAETPVTVNLEDLIPKEVTSQNVKMSNNIVCTVDVGNFKSGQTINVSDVDTLQKFLVSMLSQDRNPTVTQPSAGITLTGAGAKEVGTKFTPSYSASLNPGSYSATAEGAQTTGVTASSWGVADTDGNTSETQTGKFSEITIDDDTNYKVTVTVQHSAGSIPKTFLGENYAAGQIQAGSKTASSSSVTGYRNCFWGYKNGDDALANPENITVTEIKALGNVNRTKPAKLTTNQMKQMFFAVPKAQAASLSIQASTGLPQQVKGPVIVKVGGVDDYNPVDYNLFYVSNGIAEAGSETYTLTWN